MEKKREIRWIGAVRGLACLLVLLSHVLSLFPALSHYVVRVGKIGVWAFMLLSGMLLMRPFFEDEREPWRGPRDAAAFYAGKIRRLYPAYAAALVCACACWMIDWRAALKHLAGLEGAGHFWYMAVVLRFFAVAPIAPAVFALLRRALGREKGDALFAALALAASLALTFMYPPARWPENAIELRYVLPVFLNGMVLAYALSRLKRRSAAYDALCAAAAALLLLRMPWAAERLLGRALAYPWEHDFAFHSLWLSLLFAGLANGRAVGPALSRSRFLRLAGRHSYPLYLFHYPPLNLFLYWGWSPLRSGAAAVACALAATAAWAALGRIAKKARETAIFSKNRE